MDVLVDKDTKNISNLETNESLKLNNSLEDLDDNHSLQSIEDDNHSLQSIEDDKHSLPAIEDDNHPLQSVEDDNHSLKSIEDENLSLQSIENDNFKWFDHFFPKKSFNNDILADIDIITRHESDLRIMYFLFLTCLLNSFILVGLLITFMISAFSLTKPTIVLPRISSNNFERDFPMPHLAFILENGTVIDFSLYPDKSPSVGKLIKLPKSSMYHGYSDDQGVLYFIDGELRKPVTKIHKQLNQNGYQTLPYFLSLPNPCDNDFVLCDQKFDHGISIGSHFWLFFQSYASVSFSNTGKKYLCPLHLSAKWVWFPRYFPMPGCMSGFPAVHLETDS